VSERERAADAPADVPETPALIGVLVVDDHPMVRAGVRGLLEGSVGMTVVGEAASGDEAVIRARTDRPDVILMDLSMPGIDGVEATRQIVDGDPEARIVVLTSFHDHDRVRAAVAAGAVGYLLKDSEPTDLLAAVRAAAAGHAPLDPRVTRALLPRSGQPTAPTPPELSARERDVLDQLVKGLSNRQIARALGISERTVKVHLGHIFRQLGVADRTSAALWARDHLKA
jgi:DNA-binding NarL/FixJ family response regulator